MFSPSNWREVVDEVQALDAIYGTDFRVQSLTRPGWGDAACTHGLSLEELMQMEDPGPGATWSLACAYLPPLGLRLTLHEAYPGLAPPRLALEASWLAAPLAAKLAAALEALWHADLATQPAGYAWAEWLREGVLDRMGAGSGALRLQYLPPLVLRLTLHEAYPGLAPPRLALEASWLAAPLAAKLAAALEALWHADLATQPAGYAWAEWLREGVLESDGRGVRDEDEAQTLLANLLRHDAGCRARAWLAVSHPCGICLEDLPGPAFSRLACGHAFCSPCLGAAAELAPCPRCGVACQRDEGCNKMTCGACGAFFCYRCGRAISGYRHFGDGFCVLFDEAEILRWEEDWEARVAVHRAEQGGGEGCGQFIEKQGGNNHMLCWSCTSHFCYLCRRLLLRRGEGATHFGPSGCRQHSAD
ncbi:putative E3 ubiquitin-protein ligase [Auxenochlorella protothecoides]|uniref:Putative E3 ubiquitin-protein ligase n=1 Tax=Auxenochlorella protothecoides TaxID=3075 RepID=A0A087SIM6_AUXPR|nr:putative E3 ubiquitin-protein ligase [Auxenochlorella protothecoides]KFM25580.1 putative E3 ubiquitin-protein ligase [Auxenochlorella protothecoides]